VTWPTSVSTIRCNKNFLCSLLSETRKRFAPTNGTLRRVNAGAQGSDLTQTFDPFGNNRYTDASNPWAAFFGAPSQPWKTTSYDKYDRDSYMLPEAYAGQNEYLGKTITKMIYDDESYYTQVLMPIRFTNQVPPARLPLYSSVC